MQQDPEELLFLLEPAVLPDLGAFPFGVFHQIVPEALSLGFLQFFPAFSAFPWVLGWDCSTGSCLLVPG